MSGLSLHVSAGFRRSISVLLLVSLLGACGGSPHAASSSDVVRSGPDVMTIDLQHGWSFKTDPSALADWSAPALDASGWDVIDAGEGEFWQAQGYPGYSGVAWYRRTVTVPASWQGRSVYLAIGGVNDEYTVYVNGRGYGGAGDLATRQSAVQRPVATPIQLTAGQVNTVAVQVRSWYNFGGIVHGPVALTTSPAMPAPAVDQAVAYAGKHPAGIWPAWMSGQGRSWTVVGTPSGGAETVVGPDGRWEPTTASPSISVAILDKRTGTFSRPPAGSWSLLGGHLPLVAFGWSSNGVRVSTQLWRPPAEPNSVNWSLQLAGVGGAADDLALYVIVNGYQVQPGVAAVFSTAYRDGLVLVNGQPFLKAGQPPASVLASSGQAGDVSELLAAGHSGPAAADDGAGLASLALGYELHLQPGQTTTLTFVSTTDGGRSLAQSQTSSTSTNSGDAAAAASAWSGVLRDGGLDIPDRRLTDAYYASLAYILMSNDGGALHPGPLLHDAFWYRDSSYMLSALERNGNLAEARQLLDAIVRFQLPDGEFPANASTHQQTGHQRGDPEWDSQGQGIHALVEYYRFSHDQAWLRSVWPAISRAADWLNQLRALQADGLLPPGRSAEDIGPADQQHYWDDFWSVIGLRDAAFAAGEIGQPAAQKQLADQANQLLSSTMAASAPALKSDGIIPNGPSDLRSPAVARGSSPAVWPGKLLTPEVGRPIFQNYYDRFVKPYGGAFREADDNFWTLGGLELAHSALYLGLNDEVNAVLDWQLSHQTANGVYAWGDEVSQDGKSLVNGDMPHGWTAAEFASLVRDMLLYESGNRLELAAGVRGDWLAPGQSIAVTDMPTYFGWISYRLTAVGDTALLDLSTESPPSDGFDLHLPFAITAASLEGTPYAPASGNILHLPPNTRHAEVRFSR